MEGLLRCVIVGQLAAGRDDSHSTSKRGLAISARGRQRYDRRACFRAARGQQQPVAKGGFGVGWLFVERSPCPPEELAMQFRWQRQGWALVSLTSGAKPPAPLSQSTSV